MLLKRIHSGCHFLPAAVKMISFETLWIFRYRFRWFIRSFLICRLTHFTCESVKWVAVFINVCQGRLSLSLSNIFSLSEFFFHYFIISFSLPVSPKHRHEFLKSNRRNGNSLRRFTFLTVTRLFITKLLYWFFYSELKLCNWKWKTKNLAWNGLEK